MKRKPHIAVVGAGAFGGWTALHLLERGAGVTLLDAWGPGNSRASSGGETRVMRGAYGANQPYTELAGRALKIWARYERRWKWPFLHRCGVLWMASGPDQSFEHGSIEPLRAAKIKFEQLSAAQIKKRWPQISLVGVDWGIFEPDCGYLDARESCRAIVEHFVAQGGKYLQVSVLAEGVMDEGLENGARAGLPLSDRSRLKADAYVFACGPWQGQLFPRTVGKLIQPTRQDVFFFGAPAGSDRFSDKHLPVWGDHYERFYYGIPGNGSRGFKIADDTRGPGFDPTNGERVISQETLKRVREYLAFRFPRLKDAPLIESRVCQYEQTPDGHFIIDRHPANENVWLVGGGSGHGFKHGPAIGEMMADLILKKREPLALWKLERFRKA